jgi:DNA-binding NtrC family response regulator
MALAVTSKLRRWLVEAASDAVGPDRETLTAGAAAPFDETVPALYVIGPQGGARHLLSQGVVSLGRGTESTIVVDDPRVSRGHAALQVGGEILLSDLGSANGTFLGGQRLVPGDARRLAAGQPFFIGDSALAVCPTSLPRRCPRRVSTLDEVRERFRALAGAGADAGPHGARMIVLKVRQAHDRLGHFLESILSPTLESPRDWLMRLEPNLVLLGVETASDGDGARLERAILQHTLSWGVTTDVESKVVTCDQALRAGEELSTLLCADSSLPLRRGEIVIRDPAMEALKRTIERVAPAPVNVLILGETGAGKDVVVSMLHELSARADKPLIGLNCASLPEALLESELFGHEKGAFTGAAVSRPGLLEAADGGTVFFDEIGDLPFGLQAKLLTVIESKRVTRLGSVRARAVDVRFVAATNLDLGESSTTPFRRDLYYRLSGVTLTVPPLRERPTEIEPLARSFLKGANTRFELSPRRFSPATLAALAEYRWPGNVRELRNAVERAVLLSPGEVIEPDHLGLPLGTVGSARPTAFGTTMSIAKITPFSSESDRERERITRALAACAGNQTRAAKSLGISRRTLVRRIADLGLPRPRRVETVG